jgi:hypothetical protein
MFRDAGGGSTELTTMGDREERLPVGLSILLMLGLTALAGRFWFSLRLCSVRLVAVPNGCLPRSLRLFRHVAALLRNNEFNRPINAVDITFDLRDVLIRYISR